MSRAIQISLPSKHAETVLPKIKELNGLIGLRIHKEVSVQPEGDVIELDILNSEVNSLLLLFEREGLLRHDQVSITTSRPTSVISKSKSDEILSETHESSWEDTLKNLLHESNMTLNTKLVMFLAGLVAAIGISSNAIHVVVGAMLIAPGFEPISRLALGLVAKHRDWKNGGVDILTGYSMLIIGGMAGALFIMLLDKDVLPGSASYLPKGVLPEYWLNISITSLFVSVLASLAGGIIIMTNKSLLTAGVMVALALIPAGALVGMGLVEGNFTLAWKAFLRLLMEIGIVAVFTGSIFFWKRIYTHKRNMQV